MPRFKCPCGKILSVPEAAAGKKAKCPGCGRLLRVPEAQAGPTADVAEPEDTGDHKGRIVLAESRSADRDSAERMLADHGYRVFVAEDGEKAVDLIRRHKPDLAIVDLKTDKLSGFQVIKAITDQFHPQNREVWQTPFLMTTSKVTGRDRQYAISLGVMHYYAKPLVPAKVCARIERMMGRLPPATRRR